MREIQALVLLLLVVFVKIRICVNTGSLIIVTRFKYYLESI